MLDIHLKKRFEHPYMPDMHYVMHQMSRMVHDERFWAIAALIVLLAAIITMAFFVGPASVSDQARPLIYPYFP